MPQTTSLFKSLKDETRPLADRLRPQSLDDIVGQDHLLGPDGPLPKLQRTAVARCSTLSDWCSNYLTAMMEICSSVGQRS